jgi:ribosomal-protein-alanine N-acetyltransferase
MIKIREMTAADVPQVAALEKECFQDPWSEKSIAEELDHEYSLWLVAVENDQVLGYVGSQTAMWETDMMNIAVAPSRRREGLGNILVTELIRELRNWGSNSLALEVRVSNEPARALYESLGFHQVGLRKNYYRNPKEDALILRKEWGV